MDSRTLSALLITLLFWASAFTGIRVGLRGFGPGELALLRFLVASLILGAVAWTRGMRMPRPTDWPAFFALGLFGITIYHTALSFGEISVQAGTASLIIAADPMFAALLASFFLGERLSVWGWAGIVLSFIGVLVITLGTGAGLSVSPGAFWVLLAAASASIYFVFQKPLLTRYSSIELTSYVIWAGTALLMVFFGGLWHELPHAGSASILSIVYLGIFPGAIAYATWSYALSRAPIALVTSFLYLSPLLAILIAWTVLNELPSILSLFGGVVAIGGVVLVNSRGRVRRAH